MSDSTTVAVAVVLGVGVPLLTGFVVAPRINDEAEEHHGVRPIRAATLLVAALALLAFGLAALGYHIASVGEEPFPDARFLLPWFFDGPEQTRRLCALLIAGGAVVLAGLSVWLVRRTSVPLGLQALACLVVIGLACANPAGVPALAVYTLFEWRESIDRRSGNSGAAGLGPILIVGLGWLLVSSGELVRMSATTGGVLLGLGSLMLLGALLGAFRKAGFRCGVEAFVCASLLAPLYLSFCAILIVGATSWAHDRSQRRRT